MRRVALVRHAATEWSGVRFCGRSDPALSEAGRAQLASLRQEVRTARLAVASVRASPARRAVETAVAIGDELGVPVELDERLWEVDFGACDGRAFDDVARDHPGIASALLARRHDIDWPGGERASDVVRRLAPVALELRSAIGDALVVAHGGSIRALVRQIEPERAIDDVLPAGTVYVALLNRTQREESVR